MLLCLSKTVDSNLFFSALLLFSIAVVGFLSSIGANNTPYEIVKDIIYFIRPITIMLASYLLVKRISSLNYIFNVVVVVALFFALKHITVLLVNFDLIESHISLRSLGGKHNHVEMMALIFLLFTPNVTIFKKYRKLILFILFASFLLYLSRTMFVVLLIFYLGYKGYLFLNKKLIKGLFVLIPVVAITIIVISSIETHRDSQGIDGFIYKLQNSFTELFEPFDIDKVKRDKRGLWEHWRAFETQKALKQINESGIKGWSVGLGFGSLVDLETTVKMQGQFFTELPTIHNGFSHVLFKTGILGLMLYLLFMFLIFLMHQKFNHGKNLTLFDKLLVATSLYMFFNSFVITGIFRPGEFSMFLYGVLIAAKARYLVTSTSID